MPGLVADTHTLVWYLEGSNRLSTVALAALDAAEAAGDPIYMPSISLVEVLYLVEKNRLPPVALHRLLASLRQGAALVLAPLDQPVAEAVGRIPRETVPDMPDRIIAATAVHLGVPLVTRDNRLRESPAETIW